MFITCTCSLRVYIKNVTVGFYWVHLFYCSREGGWVLSHFESKTLEHLAQNLQVLHASYACCPAQGQTGRLVLLEGCVLSRPCCSLSLAVPSLCIRRKQSRGMHILLCLNDWLICTLSQVDALRNTALLLTHITRLRLWMNNAKISCISCYRYSNGLLSDEGNLVSMTG